MKICYAALGKSYSTFSLSWGKLLTWKLQTYVLELSAKDHFVEISHSTSDENKSLKKIHEEVEDFCRVKLPWSWASRVHASAMGEKLEYAKGPGGCDL